MASGVDRVAMIMRRYGITRESDSNDGRPSPDPALVIHDRQRHQHVRDLLLDDGAILQHVLLYASGEGYLFLGGVSTSWRDAWGDRPKVTPLTVVGQSLSCLVWGVESGCRFGGKAGWNGSWNKMSTCVLAARGGDVGALQYARRLRCEWSERACATAALEGHLRVIQWCRAHGCPWDALTCAWAARGGHLQVLQWCRANGCPWDEMTCIGAAAGGHVGVLQWCRANGCPWGALTFAAAAGAGNLYVLEWCKVNGCPWITSGEPGWDAPYRSHPHQYEFVSWLSCFTRRQLVIEGAVICAAAAKEGHLEALQWCRTNDCRWDEATCAAAASRGHLQVLQWSRENGCPWNSSTCTSAARGGHLTLLIWCRAYGCPWDEATCEGAAMNGHLEVLQWCRANGCRWDGKTWKSAVMNGRLSILQWCKASGCPTPRENFFYSCKSLDVLRWLHSNDLLRVDDRNIQRYACCGAAYSGSLDVLQWLRTERCPWTDIVSINAASCGHLEMLKWCTANGCPWNARSCAEGAASSQQLHVIRWLEARRWSFLAHCPALHRFAIAATQHHLHTCGVVAGACAAAIIILAGMIDRTLGIVIFCAMYTVPIILLIQCSDRTFTLGLGDGVVVMCVIHGVRLIITSPIWSRDIVMIVGGIIYACGRFLWIRRLRGR